MILIGELARMFGISSRTLRHYDAIGLFSPANTSTTNGYRYYRPEQIKVIATIVELRRFQVPLEQIKPLIASGALDHPAALAAFLNIHAKALQAELVQKRQMLAELKVRIDQLMQGDIMNSSTLEPTFIELPSFEAVGLSVVCEDPSPIPALWNEFRPRMHEVQTRTEPSRCYGISTYTSADSFRYYAAVGTQSGAPLPDGMERVTIDAHRYARFTHTGTIATLPNTFRTIFESLESRWGLSQAMKPMFELMDERFLGPQDQASELDIYVPILSR